MFQALQDYRLINRYHKDNLMFFAHVSEDKMLAIHVTLMKNVYQGLI